MKMSKTKTNPLRFTFRQGIRSMSTLIAVIMCGIFGFCSALFTVAELFGTSAIFDEYGNISGFTDNKDSYHYLIFQDAEYMSTMLLIAVAFCGIIAAVCSFNFITSKKMVNVYYSLGITRTKLFCGKYFSGILMLFAASLIPMIIVFFANVFTVGYTTVMLKAVIFYLLNIFLVSATAYTITSAVFAAVGTTFETAVFSSIILFIPDIFLFSIQALMDKFLYGTPYGKTFMYANTIDYGTNTDVASLPDQFNVFSPVFWGQSQINNFAYAAKNNPSEAPPIIGPEFITTILWIIATTGIFFLAIRLFNRRKAEICGFIGMNRYLNTTVSMLTAFSVFCYAIYIIDGNAAGIIAGAIAFAVVHLVLEAIVLRDMKKFTRGLYKLPIGIAVSVAAVFIFMSGLFGFSQKMPEISEIKSVSVTSAGTTDEYGLFTERWIYGNYDLSYYAYSDRLMGEFTSENDIKAVLDAHKSISETNEDDRTLENTVQFIYKLKNGSTIKRNFSKISPESYKKLLYLEDCDYYNEMLKEYFTGSIKNFSQYEDHTSEYVFANAQKILREYCSVDFFSRYADKRISVTLSKTDMRRLLDSLYTDLSNRSVEEKYYPAEAPAGIIYIDYNELLPIDEAPEVTQIENNPFSARFDDYPESSPWMPTFNTHITSDMTNTVKVLKDLGIYDEMVAVPEFVSAEVIDAETAYDIIYKNDYYLASRSSRFFQSKFSAEKPENREEDVWNRYDKIIGTEANESIITDKALISELVKNSYTVYEQDDIDKGWFVSFKTANGDTSICYIPDGKLPQGITK